MSIKVMVADDHRLFRTGLIRTLGDLRDVAVVAEAADGAEALQLAGETDAQVLLLDFNMPKLSGFELIERIHAVRPDLPLLVLSMHDEPGTIRRALKSGASGYISKDVDAETVLAAIQALARGERYVAPNLAVALALNDPQSDPLTTLVATTLTAREQEVLRLIVSGISLNQIAEQLHLSPKTVTTHKSNLMGKLGIRNNSDLIRYALENGYASD
jgi:DNA-binding NarL/FixJ family response regulator